MNINKHMYRRAPCQRIPARTLPKSRSTEQNKIGQPDGSLKSYRKTKKQQKRGEAASSFQEETKYIPGKLRGAQK